MRSRRHIPFTGTLRRVSLLAAMVVSLLATSAQTALAGPVDKGIWLSLSEIQALPMAGTAWTAVKQAADGSLGSASVANQDSSHDVQTLAVALVYARTADPAYRAKAAAAITSAIGTEVGGRTLALGRNLVSYVIAADLINLREYDPAADTRFRSWLSTVRRSVLDGRTLVSTHEERPNNWGTHAGASRIAADLYLSDVADLARAADVFRGWLGDRTAYAGFRYGDLWWQSDPTRPVGINPVGARIQGQNVDGVLPDDQRRGGSFTWPPPKENYVYEALQGGIVQAQLLARAGYPAWQWGDRALLRAFTWLHSVAGYPAEGDDQWQPWLVNAAYGTSFPASPSARSGKNMGWTAWTAGPTSSSSTTGTSGTGSTTTTAAKPVGDFTATPVSGTAPLTVGFSDRSSGSPTSWRWDFGDGSVSTQRSPSHTYVAAGTYTVTLTVSNSAGSSTTTRANLVTVSAPSTTSTGTTPGGTTTQTVFNPVADAVVKASYPTKNYGSDTMLRARSADYRSYLRFTVTGISGTVKSVKLRIYATSDTSNAGAIYRVADTAWVESAITWQTAPGYDATAVASNGARATMGTWLEYDVTAMVSGNGTYSFALVSGATSSVWGGSRETPTPPQLVVTGG